MLQEGVPDMVCHSCFSRSEAKKLADWFRIISADVVYIDGASD